ncbi:helix-turn-helix transcriptional regulator [Novosphingobium sp. Gsoil 351]|uniref:helix-turn-helix domain-containing protein n=1 Tax=Novosphingobium sp. Gsoil 351 TaxID=2675225 RepID=UPI0018A805EC|nr:helix-turn-helix transcriptional regulator [Novosphingobium sp. Gsoil 351]
MHQIAQFPECPDLIEDDGRLGEEQRAQLARITPKQREVLRLALVRKSSKEIGRELGIAPRSVDQRLDAARITLGAASRFEAARKFNALVRTSEGLTSEPFLLGESGAERGGMAGEQPLYVFGDALHFSGGPAWEDSTPVDPAAWQRFVPGLPSAASGSRDRIVWIMIGAVSILTLVLIGLAVVESLKRLVDGG